MKQILFLFVIVIFSDCAAYRPVPLKGNYNQNPFEVRSNNDFETVWGKTIEYFAKNGIGAKLIDKSSGFIVAQNIKAPVTVEDKNGNLEDPNAWVVTTKYYDPGSRQFMKPSSTTVEWNIYIKKEKDNSTVININLIDAFTDFNTYQPSIIGGNSEPTTYKARALSTGVFEKKISEAIK